MDRYPFPLEKRPISYGIYVFVDVSYLRHGRFFGAHLSGDEGISADDAGRGVYVMHFFGRISLRLGAAKGSGALSLEL